MNLLKLGKIELLKIRGGGVICICACNCDWNPPKDSKAESTHLATGNSAKGASGGVK